MPLITGTFRMIATAVYSAVGSWNPLTTWRITDAADITYPYSEENILAHLEICETTNPVLLIATAGFEGEHVKLIGGDEIIVDGVTTLKSELPLGWHVSSITWEASIWNPGFGGDTTFRFTLGGGLTNNSDPFTFSTANTCSFKKNITLTFLNSDPFITNDVLTQPWGIEVDTIGPTDPRILKLNYLAFRGTYEIFSLQWTLASPPTTRAVQAGDTITFTSDSEDPNAMDFTQIETITFGDVDVPSGYWIDVQPNLLQFILPPYTFEDPNVPIPITVTSTQFSGSVELQSFWAVEFQNAPGIYTLVNNRKHDTYYDRTVEPLGTIDTKIPNPTGRTNYY